MLAWILTALVTVWGVLLGGIGFLAWRFYRIEPGEGPTEAVPVRAEGSSVERLRAEGRTDGRRGGRRRRRNDRGRRRSRTVYPRRRIPRKVVL